VHKKEFCDFIVHHKKKEISKGNIMKVRAVQLIVKNRSVNPISFFLFPLMFHFNRNLSNP
jgi:hypothetical protein